MLNKYTLIAIAITAHVQWSTAQECLTLVHADEFNYTGLPDSDKWSFEVQGPGWVNNELQNYTGNRTENARVENGSLIIEARADNYQGHQYSSARINSNNKMTFQYGRIEFRAKLPTGRGTWPALWLMPTDIYKYATTCSQNTGWISGCDAWPNSGEIDVMEYVGWDAGIVHGSAHTKNANFSSGGNFTEHTTISNEGTVFHVYALEWTETSLEYFVDDASYGKLLRPNDNWEDWPFDQPFYPIINIAIGGNWGGAQGVDAGIFPAQLVVDYVRMYEFTTGGSQEPYDGLISIPGKIEAENFDVGCSGEAYSDSDVENWGGGYRDETVDIEVNGGTGITNVGYISDGEWLAYSVNVSTDGTYIPVFKTASFEVGGAVSIYLDEQLVLSNLQLPVTDGWQTYFLTSGDGIAMTAGNHEVKIQFETGQFNFDYLDFTISSDLSEERMSLEQVKLYPNPANSTINLQGVSDAQYRVLGVDGRSLLSGSVRGQSIDVSQLSNGVYHLELTKSGQVKNMRFTKH